MKKDSLIQGNIGKALLRNGRNGVSNDYDAAYNLSVSCYLHFSDSTEIWHNGVHHLDLYCLLDPLRNGICDPVCRQKQTSGKAAEVISMRRKSIVFGRYSFLFSELQKHR